MSQASGSMSQTGDASPAQQPTAPSLEPEAATEEIATEEDEWEYEYSATETETYYLTVELSYPEFKGQAAKSPHHSRGGYYKHWLGRKQSYIETSAGSEFGGDAHDWDKNKSSNNNDNNDNEDKTPGQPAPPQAAVARDTNSGQTGEDATAAGDDRLDIDPALFAPQRDPRPEQDDNEPGNIGEGDNVEGPRENTEAREEAENGEDEEDQLLGSDEVLEDIQILDLHSDHPVISYRGRVFEGQWAEVIGTEAIFARRNPNAKQPLPALRNLPENIDFLAASASRILTKEKIMKPRKPIEDSLAAIRKEWNIKIPRGRHKNGEKMKQVHFLERLIALKMKKGETDKVTVFAKDGAGKDFRDDRDPEFRPRRKRAQRIRAGSESGEETGNKRKRSGRPRGRPRTRVGSEPRGLLHRDIEAGGLSQPTPSHWEDLESGEDVVDEDEEEIGDADSSDYDMSEGSRRSDGSNQSDTHDEDNSDGAGDADPAADYEDITMAE
uniref:Transcription factor TFIIIC triple barrel domain-containing protein n=1 Tax=Bionectria ochroleuca TaxID=29856 RepID=A0A8H7TS96_BIOOC